VCDSLKRREERLGDNLLDEMRRVQRKVWELLAKTESEGDHRGAIVALREVPEYLGLWANCWAAPPCPPRANPFPALKSYLSNQMDKEEYCREAQIESKPRVQPRRWSLKPRTSRITAMTRERYSQWRIFMACSTRCGSKTAQDVRQIGWLPIRSHSISKMTLHSRSS